MNYESHLFVTYLRLWEIGDQCHINISSGGSLGQVPSEKGLPKEVSDKLGQFTLPKFLLPIKFE